MGLRRNAVIESPPPFNFALEKERRRLAVLDREKELSDATERVKVFQGQHYSVGPGGALVPKISTGTVSNFDIDQQHGRLVRSMSAAHDRFQAALKSFAEISE
jgi:hypothetical protein